MSAPTDSDSIYKVQATRLRAFLAENGVQLKHTHALEAVAQMHGAKNWHVLQAQRHPSLPPDEMAILKPTHFIPPSEAEQQRLIQNINDEYCQCETDPRCIAIAVKEQNRYWTLWEDPTSHQKTIALRSRHKLITEEEGPVAADCPIDWLDYTEISDPAWRARVRTHNNLDRVAAVYGPHVPPLAILENFKEYIPILFSTVYGINHWPHPSISHAMDLITDYVGYLSECMQPALDIHPNDTHRRQLEGDPEREFALFLKAIADAIEGRPPAHNAKRHQQIGEFFSPGRIAIQPREYPTNT